MCTNAARPATEEADSASRSDGLHCLIGGPLSMASGFTSHDAQCRFHIDDEGAPVLAPGTLLSVLSHGLSLVQFAATVWLGLGGGHLQCGTTPHDLPGTSGMLY